MYYLPENGTEVNRLPSSMLKSFKMKTSLSAGICLSSFSIIAPFTFFAERALFYSVLHQSKMVFKFNNHFSTFFLIIHRDCSPSLLMQENFQQSWKYFRRAVRLFLHFSTSSKNPIAIAWKQRYKMSRFL